MTGNAWEWLGSAPTRTRERETTRTRDNETTGLRDHETARLRDCETYEKHSRSQAFSGVLSCSQSCVAVRGSLASEWCSSVLSQKRVPWDSTKTYSPRHSTFWDRTLMRRYHAKGYSPLRTLYHSTFQGQIRSLNIDQPPNSQCHHLRSFCSITICL